MKPGYSYLASINGNESISINAGQGISVEDSASIYINVAEGIANGLYRWSLLANPFNCKIHVQDLIDNNLLVSGDQYFKYNSNEDQWIDTTGYVDKYQSFLVCLRSGGKIKLSNISSNDICNFNESKSPIKKMKVIIKDNNLNRDYHLYAGFSCNSNDKLDENDLFMPPLDDKKINYYLLNQDIPEYKLFSDIRKIDTDLYKFEIVIEIKDMNEYYLILKNISLLKSYQYLLYDEKNGVFFKNDKVQLYKGINQFTLFIGKKYEIDKFRKKLEIVPDEYNVSFSYPNPFNNETGINIDLPDYSKLKVYILNTNGQIVDMLIDDDEIIGSKRIIWDSYNRTGRFVSSGIYFIIVETKFSKEIRKVSLIR